MTGKNKKNLDLIPPQISDNFNQEISKIKASNMREKKSLFSTILIIGAVLLFIVAAAYFFIPQKAEITIQPNIEKISLEAIKEVPAKFVRSEQALPEKFYSFDKEEIEKRAEGTIRIYNEFHLEQPLVAHTRLWCGGKEEIEFKTKEMVTIPSGEYLDVNVVASLPGEEFNVLACKTFILPGLSGTARYTAVHGDSFSLILGGEIFTNVLVVEKSELENIAREYLISQIPSEKKMQEGSLRVGHSSYSVNLEEETVTLSLDLQISAGVYTAINQESFKKAVSGIDSERARRLIVDFPEIDEIHIKLWPFWVTRVPEDPTAIDIELDV